MACQMEILLLEKCGAYAYNNSIAAVASAAKVVTLWKLEQYLSTAYFTAYNKVMQNHNSLEEFLRYTGRDIVRSGAIQSWRDWNYEVMSFNAYKDDKRHDHNYFAPLLRIPVEGNAPLMVFYLKEDKRRYEAERTLAKRGIAVPQNSTSTAQKQRLSQDRGVQNRIERETHENGKTPKRIQDLSEEINNLYQSLIPTQKEMDDVKNVKNRIQVMVNQVWPGQNYQVVLFGSSANSLALRDADVDLCILVPQETHERDLHRYRSRITKQPKSIYNMFFLASRLREMGMKNVEAIGSAQVPICKFVDPQTGYHCDINTNNALGIENSELIKEYCSLDSRIRPLIFAVKYFVKQKNINNPRGGTLSSYTYVIMILHFLMKVLQKPVIPSLQETPQRCSLRNCNFNFNRHVSLLQDNQIVKWNPRYHDCLYIDNVKTRKFNMQYRNTGTRWEGQNMENVGQLLRSFFRYFANKEHFQFSIISASGAIQQPQNIQSTNCPFVIQDPFIRTKNVARSCTDAGSRVITLEFDRAAKMLADGIHTFEDVCKLPSNIPRPVDTQSMEFRFQQRTVKTQQKQSNGRQVEITHQEDKKVRVSENEVKELGKSFGIFEDSDEEQNIPTVFNNPTITVENPLHNPAPLYVGGIQYATDEDIKRYLARSDKSSHQPTSSSNSSSSTTQKPADVKPILNLIQTLMEHKPFIGENTPVESYTSKPCTDMSKLLESSAAKDVSARDICYLIAQLNFLGDALAEKITSTTTKSKLDPVTNSTQSRKQSSNESFYIRELQDMFDGIDLDDSADNYYLEEDEDDDEDEEELLVIRPGKFQNVKYKASDVVTIEYYVTDSPDEHVEKYQLYSTLQYYGLVKDIQYMDAVFKVWKVTMIIFYAKLETLPAKLDVGYGNLLKAYAVIIA